MRKLFTTLSVLLMAAATMAQVPSYVPTNGLVGYWPFNGNANDESGNGNNGTVNGATLTTDRFGNANAAYNFDGTSDFIQVPDDNSLDLTNQYTLSVWFKIPDYTIGPALPGNLGGVDEARTIFGKPRTYLVGLLVTELATIRMDKPHKC